MALPTAIMLFGPTASGKTALAIQLAQQLNAVIINADSQQMYQEMPILTAMPSAEEFAAAPHQLFSVLAPTQKFNVADYLSAAGAAAKQVVAEGKTPLFVGGTGFYLQALAQGISPIPPVDETLVEHLTQQAAQEGTAALHAKLVKVDPQIAARLEVGDTHRVVRALSVFQATGVPLSTWQSTAQSGALPYSFHKIALHPVRNVVVSRINKRFEAMLQMGVLDEVKALKEKYGDIQKLPCRTMHGLRELSAHLDGALSLEEAKELLLAQTRQYAKRQATWIRNSYGADTTVEEPNISLLKNLRISA